MDLTAAIDRSGIRITHFFIFSFFQWFAIHLVPLRATGMGAEDPVHQDELSAAEFTEFHRPIHAPF
jgi:hypothetical protein